MSNSHSIVFSDHLRLERNASTHTVKSYAEDLFALRDYLQRTTSGTDIAELSTRTIRAFLADLHASGYSASTVSRKLSSLRSFCRFLCRDGLMDRNPAEGLRAKESSSFAARSRKRSHRKASQRACGGCPPRAARDRALWKQPMRGACASANWSGSILPISTWTKGSFEFEGRENENDSLPSGALPWRRFSVGSPIDAPPRNPPRKRHFF